MPEIPAEVSGPLQYQYTVEKTGAAKKVTTDQQSGSK